MPESCIAEPGGFTTTFMEKFYQPSDNSRNEPYAALSDIQEKIFAGFDAALQNNPEQRPQKVADAITELIERPFGERPFRTVVDYMGMGEHIKKYNEVLTNITYGIYSAFDNEGMLKAKS